MQQNNLSIIFTYLIAPKITHTRAKVDYSTKLCVEVQVLNS